VLPVYILDDCNSAPWQMGAASRWWLHQSLEALDAELQNKLVVLKGDPEKLIPQLVAKHNVQLVCWNRCYEPWRSAETQQLNRLCRKTALR
jgi:deoxyribodipyrimidine photo-lyase